MEKYVKGNKEAWEEAFELRDLSWGQDIVEKIKNNKYAFLNKETVEVLEKYDLRGKRIGQFCCNNGRELLSLVKSVGAQGGIGFDIAENQVDFANEKAKELVIPCEFVAGDILSLNDKYTGCFDFVIITIGALCWFKDLSLFFKIVSKTLKNNGVIIINEQHPFTNMIACDDEEEYDSSYPLNCIHSYFQHEWTGNDGMYYMTQKTYKSKTFTDFTHSLSEIVGAMCKNDIVITNLEEFDHDLSGMFGALENKQFPLSMLIEGCKN